MSARDKPRVLIVGAGSMGIVVGYHATLAGADVTFLIRPHHAERLQRPQILYYYDDDQLKEYKGYSYITNPSDLLGPDYDFVVITLDGASLQNEAGQKLVSVLGDALRKTKTMVLLGSVSFGLRSWFLEASGLRDEQVTNAYLAIHAHPTKGITLPVSPEASLDLNRIKEADLAYTDRLGAGLQLDDSAPLVASAFSEIYNVSGVSRCVIRPAVQCAVEAYPIFAVFAACELMDWPDFKDIDRHGEVWTLATAAVREIQGLGIHGTIGQQAAESTTEDGLADSLAAWEKQMLPLRLQEFNRFHHGSKVNSQDRKHLAACIACGEGEGKPMTALRKLISI